MVKFMPILLEFHIVDVCCTGQANVFVSLERTKAFGSKIALMRYFSELFSRPINNAFKRTFSSNYNKGICDRTLCEHCGIVYVYGEPGLIERTDMKKTRFDTF